MDDLDREILDRLSALERKVQTPPSRVPQSGGSGGGGAVRLVTVLGVGNDTLNCSWRGQIMTVYKPYELQKTPFHGVGSIIYLNASGVTVSYSYTSATQRTATSSAGAVVASEEITPAYISGGKILAQQADDGNWYDTNGGGRVWAQVS